MDSGAGPADAEPTTERTSPVPWALLATGVLVAGIGSFIGYRRQDQLRRAARRRQMVRTAIEKLSTEAGRR
jgi:hypothetical protein